MAGKKYLKKNIDGKWVIISAPESYTINQYLDLESGDKITDTNVIVKNINYSADSGTTTLDDTLTQISNDIEKLKRNEAWFAEHGGGGGTGGGGGATYGIVLKSPILENNAVYISESSFEVKFMITGGTSVDTFNYKWTFDGTYTEGTKAAGTNEDITVKIDNINIVSTGATHTFYIEATNPYGLPIVPVNFRIYESSLKLALDPNKNNISNNEVLISLNNVTGDIYLNLKNGVLNSQNTVSYECNSETGSTTWLNSTTAEQPISISAWSVIKSPIPDTLYTMENVYAQATLGSTINNKTEKFSFNIRVTNPNEMSVYFDGLSYFTDAEASKIEQADRLQFSFKTLLPLAVTNNTIYYAARINTPDGSESYYIAGKSFDDATYSENLINTSNVYIPIQYPLNNFEIGEGWTLEVKAWTYDGQISTIRKGKFEIIQSNSEIFPRQHNRRYSQYGDENGDTCLFAWDAYSRSSEGKWVSEIKKYMPIISQGQSHEDIETLAYMTPYNTNGRNSGLIIDEEVPYMRLQNEAYAIADMSDYADEIRTLTNPAYIGQTSGFTVSVTFECDDNGNKEKTVFLWGKNNPDGTLYNGCKIGAETVEFYLNGSKSKGAPIKAFARPGKKNTVDFVYQNGIMYIYVNGVTNGGEEIGELKVEEIFALPTSAYFGCDVIDGQICKYSDVKIYEFALYTQPLNPLQLVVNGKNARLDGKPSDPAIIEEYRAWKKKNLIYNEEDAIKKALSYLIDRETGEYSYNAQQFPSLQANSPIPVIRINAGEGFTQDFFHKDYSDDKSVTGKTFTCTIEYYDPLTKKTIEFKAKISIQGTSTLGYWVKNIEIIVDEACSEDSSKSKLLQIREDWFPEREYTLKADIVDSAHANNATIGGWINSQAGIMEDNPAMAAFRLDENRPKDKAFSTETPKTHTDSRDGHSTIDFDEKVTMKHNLEGFPVLLLIKFSDTSDFKLIGIYSFNLGRYSYYNMGMKFLKAFSRRTKESLDTVTCPALVDYYEEYGPNELFGGVVKQSGIFSYEFGAKADDNDILHQTWTQHDKSVLQLYGGFNYNGPDPTAKVEDNDEIWDKLSNLFYITATMGNQEMSAAGFGGKDHYQCLDKENLIKIEGMSPYSLTTDNMSTFNERLSITNAVGYFVIAIAFGMIDSLGKNLTLRTWDGGEKWWVCFYDMDSALALSNEGSESISETAHIDTYYNVLVNNRTITQVIAHDSSSQYNAYNSKLWEIFRNATFIYETRGANAEGYYNTTWTTLRQGALSTYQKFIDIMEKQIGNCGELIYDYDYYSKYIQNTANISMLHGLRIEYVRNWLKNRLYFFDGVFEDKTAQASAFEDSPFYYNSTNISNRGHNAASTGFIPYIFRSTAPVFIKINTGAGEITSKYYLPAYTDVQINTSEHTSQKQTSYGASNLLTKFEGLTGIEVTSLSTNNAEGQAHLPSLINFDISGTQFLDNNPINFETIFIHNGESALESVNLSNTSFGDETGTLFNVDLRKFKKVKNINISHSDVSNLDLPASVLQVLNITYSKITNFEMSNQPLLSTVDFTGCNRLGNIMISSCEGLTDLAIESLPLLNSVSISQCNSLSSITIKTIPTLSKVSLLNNVALKKLTISGCTNPNLKIEILGSPLEEITIIGYKGTSIIRLPSKAQLSNLKTLNLSDSLYIEGLKYDNEVPTYEYSGETYTVLDLSLFDKLDEKTINLRNLINLKYLKLKNDRNKPFDVVALNLSSLTSLRRVFGHIAITTGGVFNGLKNFYVNEPVVNEEGYAVFETPVFVDYDDDDSSTWYTNVFIAAANISDCFAGTNCTLSDVYYIMQSCHNTTGTTENPTIITTNISGLFSGCKNVIQIREDEEPIIDERLFDNCNKIELFDNVLSGTEIVGKLPKNLFTGLNELQRFYSPFGLDYTGISIDAQNCIFPTGITEIYGFSFSASGNFIADGKLLNGLTELRTIANSFNSAEINFARPADLFTTNTKIEKITSSFRKMRVKSRQNEMCAAVENLFAANSLKIIKDSFTTEDNPDLAQDPLILVINNDFFNGCPIEELSNSLSGENIIKIVGKVLNEPGTEGKIRVGDCTYIDENGIEQIEAFPYHVFSGYTNIVNVDGFFSNAYSEYSNYLVDTEKTLDTSVAIKLPFNGMFDTLTNVETMSNMFSNIHIKYELAPNGFRKCTKLADVSGMFNDENKSRVGQIPYRLFYTEGANTITNMARCFAYSTNKELTPYTCTDYDFDNYLSIENPYYISADITPDEHKYLWNIWIFDGTPEFINKLSTVTAFVKTKELYEIIDESGSTEGYEEWMDGENHPLWERIPEQFLNGYIHHIDGTIPSSDSGYDDPRILFGTDNYICSPDLFKYCVNTSDLVIDGVLSSTNSGPSNIVNSMSGMYGKLPPFLFDCISNIRSLATVFDGAKGILPHIWGHGGTAGDTLGEMYPAQLFSKLTKVVNISSLFGHNVIWGKCIIPSTIFSSCARSIVYASSLFESTVWVDNLYGGTPQIGTGLFNGFASLEDVSAMFHRGSGIRIYPIFNSVSNSLIRNVNGFMRMADAKGEVPEFWNGWDIYYYNGCYNDMVEPETQITNYGSIPDEYKIYSS